MARWDKPVSGPGGIGGQGQVVHGSTGAVPSGPIYGSDPTAPGVWGESNTGPGVLGKSVRAPAAIPGSGESDGVQGESFRNGVHGISHSSSDSGVWGENKGGGYGVGGSTNSNFLLDPNIGTAGVWGHNFGSRWGIKGTSAGGDGVFGYSWSNVYAGVSALNESGGVGVFAKGAPAGRFDGNVEINGDLNIASQGDVILNDCAEHFDVVDGQAEPGTVMVIDRDGNLRPSFHPYDKKVVGVVSGAGNFKPGIILGKRQSQDKGLLIALLGKVYCKVDACRAPIEVGDLLTTSDIQGHAMKAEDPMKAFGAVIGKALSSLERGRGMIQILIALQ
jgi:hypothetical protein